MNQIYLDYAATTPTDKRVIEAMLPYFGEVFGNPSSIHAFGQEAKAAVEEAREKIAVFLGADPAEIVFTSGGTESDNFAIKGVAYCEPGEGQPHHHLRHRAPCRPGDLPVPGAGGIRVTYLPVDGDGLVDPAAVAGAITEQTILISIMHANNEIGTIQPVAEIGRLAHERGILFHTDAVQTFGHLPFTARELDCDLLSVSAHKLYGPKGVGLLYIRKGTRIVPFMNGGEQESGRRASTLNVPGIVGFGKAVELAGAELAEETERLTAMRDRLIRGLFERLDGIRLNGHPTQRLPNNINVSAGGCGRGGDGPEPGHAGDRRHDRIGLLLLQCRTVARPGGDRGSAGAPARIAPLQPGALHEKERHRHPPGDAALGRRPAAGPFAPLRREDVRIGCGAWKGNLWMPSGSSGKTPFGRCRRCSARKPATLPAWRPTLQAGRQDEYPRAGLRTGAGHALLCPERVQGLRAGLQSPGARSDRCEGPGTEAVAPDRLPNARCENAAPLCRWDVRCMLFPHASLHGPHVSGDRVSVGGDRARI